MPTNNGTMTGQKIPNTGQMRPKAFPGYCTKLTTVSYCYSYTFFRLLFTVKCIFVSQFCDMIFPKLCSFNFIHLCQLGSTKVSKWKAYVETDF